MTRTSRGTKWIGAAVGIALAVALVFSWHVGADGGVLPADISMQAHPSGELELRPAADFLSAPALTVGGPSASGTVRLRNITPVALDVRARLAPSSKALDRALAVRLAVRDRTLADGRLGSLRGWSAGSVRIHPGRSAVLHARAAIPAGPSAAAAGGQDVDVTVEFRARPVGGSR
jgi:hypothetical protein